jgi:threonine dehydrogenase-like Zn-dependent dehydrogenase
MGGGGIGEGGHTVHYRGICSRVRHLPDWRCDEQKHPHEHGQLSSPKYIPRLIEMTLAGRVDPSKILTQVEPLTDAISAFKSFDKHESGWIKVKLEPSSTSSQERQENVKD